MKSISRWGSMLLGCAVLSGCAAMGMSPVTGALYSDVQAPLAVTSNTGASKSGSSSCSSILGLVATGDCSIGAAMKAGGITRVHHVDYHTNSILGLYASFTVTAWGE